ncbi:ATP-dependent DNA ligase [Nocardioides sp. Kera G14]|uniref:ATP-dependent DNA ligase n=1 Tax=Nocardioides sp. Kera G14 TaxID=2884264 RepID=UPI001D125CFF|nr:ATP-dependent DNA ligase [Nocardioides sp. Kera G14]UDY23015.1 ATP-dependent DNA ligase [Nocardioides sp. Kera G14]
MDLPVMPPVLPMLAKPQAKVPTSGGIAFEPKWDGFRCLVFRDGEEIELASRTAKSLTRYFPELVESLRTALPTRCVVDGELFVAFQDRLEFELLQQRIHPAASRVQKLAVELPASFVAFDLLALDTVDCMALPFRERRAALAGVLSDLSPTGQVHLARTTEDPAEAERWFREFEGAGFDGVVGKPLDAPYAPNQRTMIKVKHARTADVVVAGMRPHKTSTDERPLLGSLLLGLYDAGGLQHVGVCATFTDARRAELWAELSELEVPIEGHPWSFMGEGAIANPDRVPGTQSRWSGGKDLSFVPLAPTRVVEVGYDHMEGRRFRHTTQFKRWRPDRDPTSCDYDQLETVTAFDLSTVFEE